MRDFLVVLKTIFDKCSEMQYNYEQIDRNSYKKGYHFENNQAL